MAVYKWKSALQKVLTHEGGWSNHPADPGGVTLNGITQRTYDSWRTKNGLKPRPLIKAMIGDAEWERERDAIYRDQYAAAIRFDDLPAGVDYVVFDGAANSGPVQSVKWLQRALFPLYRGKIDGHIGEQTLEALRIHNNHDALIGAILDRRLDFLEALKTFKEFGKGWKIRVAGVRAVGQAWAMGNVGPEIAYVQGGERKASISDARPMPTLALADMSTGAGMGGGSLAGTVVAAKEQLLPLAGSSTFIDNAIVVLTIGAVVFTIGGIAYRVWANRRRDKVADILDLSEVAPA